MMRLRTAMSQWFPAAAKARPWNGLGGVRMGVWAFGCSCIEIMAARLLPAALRLLRGSCEACVRKPAAGHSSPKKLKVGFSLISSRFQSGLPPPSLLAWDCGCMRAPFAKRKLPRPSIGRIPKKPWFPTVKCACLLRCSSPWYTSSRVSLPAAVSQCKPAVRQDTFWPNQASLIFYGIDYRRM